ncbi:MAG: DoxX family protein [Cyanobacteria bacterium]|nr:DoxX family protein [Cyanobacteriota bacterium]
MQASRWLLSVLFVFAGVMHFVRPEFFVRIVPPVLPCPLELVWISGFFEVLLGAMVHFKRTRKLSRGGLTLLLLAVFPANIYMAINSHLFRFLPSAVLWGRLPLQIALMGWVWLATRESD